MTKLMINFLYSSKEKTRIVQNTLIKMLSSLKFYNSFGTNINLDT